MLCFWYCTRGWIYDTKNVRDSPRVPSHQPSLRTAASIPLSPSIHHHFLLQYRWTHTHTQDTHTKHTHVHIKEETLQAFPLINTCSFFDYFSWSFPAPHASCYILFPGNPFPVKPHWTATLANMCWAIAGLQCTVDAWNQLDFKLNQHILSVILLVCLTHPRDLTVWKTPKKINYFEVTRLTCLFELT